LGCQDWFNLNGFHLQPPVFLDWLPWSHTFGGNHNFIMALRNGGTLIIDNGKPAPAKLQDIDPRHYLTDVLERIVSGCTKINQLHTLLPWTWKAEREGLEAKLAA
jgi:acyl-CoA synthetase (AMP-forming)/AMP-acid ligase II